MNMEWETPPPQLVLGNDEVHIWRVPLDIAETDVQKLKQLLTPDEVTRAMRFHFARDQAHFIVARGTLRAILGRYLGQHPSTLQFHYNQYGKPFLDTDVDNRTLSFNVSHSHNLALYAVTYNREVGIDVEFIQPDRASLDIAERFFSAYEFKTLRALDVQQQPLAFFSCWTRKEAYIKARSMGLSLELNLFDVTLIPGEPAALLDIREPDQDVADWSLHNLTPAPDYAAALAVKGSPYNLACWHWPGL